MNNDVMDKELQEASAAIKSSYIHNNLTSFGYPLTKTETAEAVAAGTIVAIETLKKNSRL